MPQPQHQLLAPHELSTSREQAKLSHLVSNHFQRQDLTTHSSSYCHTLPHTRYSRHDFWGKQAETSTEKQADTAKNLENRLVHSTWDPLQSPSLGKQLVLSSHLLCCHGLCVQFHQAAFVFFSLKALLNISQWEGNLRAVT